jgi:hypothetical protein
MGIARRSIIGGYMDDFLSIVSFVLLFIIIFFLVIMKRQPPKLVKNAMVITLGILAIMMFYKACGN